MKKVLQTYMRRLVNLTSTNRSLFLGKLGASRDFDLQALPLTQFSNPIGVIEAFLSGKDRVRLCPVQDSRAAEIGHTSRTFRSILSKDNFLKQESGANDLHLAWPFLEGSFADGTIVRAPLFYFPCALEEVNGDWVLSIRSESRLFFNRSLLLAYCHYQNVAINEQWWDADPTEWSGDMTIFLTKAFEYLKNSPFEIQFNRELFDGKLRFFKEWKREELSQAYGIGVLKLQPEAVLGLFPQADSYLMPDYEKIIAESEDIDFASYFSRKYTPDFIAQVKEENLYHCFNVDGSQEQVLRMVRAGRSVVVQGPPGSGKSELICNLATDYISRGKKVLVVSQKRAALDVVYARLGREGMAAFCALVHDYKEDRKRLYENIAEQIDAVPQYYKANSGLDILKLDRLFTEYSRQIDQCVTELDAYTVALLSTSRFGISAKELYLSTEKEVAWGQDLQGLFVKFDWSSYQQFRAKAAMLLPLIQRLGHAHPWLARKSFAHFNASDLERLKKALLALKAMEDELVRMASQYELALTNDDWQQWPTLLSQLSSISEMRKLLSEQEWKAGRTGGDASLQSQLNLLKRSAAQAVFTEQTDLNFQDRFQFQIQEWEHRSGLGFWWAKCFHKDRQEIAEHLHRHRLSFNQQGLRVLRERLEALSQWRRTLVELNSGAWKGCWTGLTEIAIAERAQTIGLLLANLDYSSLPLPLKQFVALEMPLEKWNSWIGTWTQYGIEDKLWQELFCSEQRLSFRAAADLSPWINTLVSDGERLCAIDTELTTFNHAERRIVDALVAGAATVPLETMDRAVYLAWLHELEEQYPQLKNATSGRNEMLSVQLGQAMAQRKEIETQIVLARLKENTYAGVEFNRLQNMVTYRDLRHQVSKKRQVWPIRKLMAECTEDLFRLAPCWLASPETVSAVFPLTPIFDLVIFDEASQCFAEKAIPAAYRGKQVVVAGDDKQLRPNELYLSRWDNDSEETPELETESWLDLAGLHLPSVMLRGHYRSRYPELIEFSNRQFYKGKLSFLPHKADLIGERRPIEYYKVPGVWQEQRNEMEASAVVEFVVAHLKENAGKTLGVVTFNYKQTAWIDELLSETLLSERLTRPQWLFVKNIENIQGDERDVIVFSIAYAPDRAGKFSMQFGSLNSEGGENRLNVAITRAKEKIVLVTSILPQQLKTDALMHQGPALLRQYLEFAKAVSEGSLSFNEVKGQSHRAEWYLGPVLARGLQTSFADLTLAAPFEGQGWLVKRGERTLGFLLTDDIESNTTAKEFYAWLPQRLRQKGWPVHMVYSRAYWKDCVRTALELEGWLSNI